MGQIHDGCRHYNTGSPVAIVPTGKFCGYRYVREGDSYPDGATIAVNNVEIVNCVFNGPLTITGSNVRVRGCSFENVAGTAVTIDGTSNVILNDINLQNIDDTGVLINNSSDITVRDVRGGEISTAHATSNNPSPSGDYAALRIVSSSDVLIDAWRTSNLDADGFAVITSSEVTVLASRLKTISADHEVVTFGTSMRSAMRVHLSNRVHTFASSFIDSHGAGPLVTGVAATDDLCDDVMFLGCVMDGAYGRTASSALGDSLNYEEGRMARVIACTAANGAYDGIKHGNAVEGSVTLANYCYDNGIVPTSHGDGFNVAGSYYGMLGFNWFKDNHRDGMTIKGLSSPNYKTHDWAIVGNIATGSTQTGFHYESSQGAGTVAYHRTTMACNIAEGNGLYGMSNDAHDVTSFGYIGANNGSGVMAVGEDGERHQYIGDIWHNGTASTSNFLAQVRDPHPGRVDVQFGYILALGVDPISENLLNGDVDSGGSERPRAIDIDGREALVSNLLTHRFSDADVYGANLSLNLDRLSQQPLLYTRTPSANYRYREQGQARRATEVRTDTDGRTLTRGDTGILWSNEGASALASFDLPSADEGDTFIFSNESTFGMEINAASGDNITVEGATSDTAGSIMSTEVGAYLLLVAVNETTWVAHTISGTWSVSVTV